MEFIVDVVAVVAGIATYKGLKEWWEERSRRKRYESDPWDNF